MIDFHKIHDLDERFRNMFATYKEELPTEFVEFGGYSSWVKPTIHPSKRDAWFCNIQCKGTCKLQQTIFFQYPKDDTQLYKTLVLIIRAMNAFKDTYCKCEKNSDHL